MLFRRRCFLTGRRLGPAQRYASFSHVLCTAAYRLNLVGHSGSSPQPANAAALVPGGCKLAGCLLNMSNGEEGGLNRDALLGVMCLPPSAPPKCCATGPFMGMSGRNKPTIWEYNDLPETRCLPLLPRRSHTCASTPAAHALAERLEQSSGFRVRPICHASRRGANANHVACLNRYTGPGRSRYRRG